MEEHSRVLLEDLTNERRHDKPGRHAREGFLDLAGIVTLRDSLREGTSLKRFVGVYKANGGIVGEIAYVLGHLVGARECNLCDITHSPIKKKSEFKKLEKQLLAEFGIEFRLVHMNERTTKELAASTGREPCVLLEHEDGSLSMFLDYVELKACDGRVSSFEK